MLATVRAVPYAVAVSRRFAHITGDGLRELAAHRLEKPAGGTGGRPKRLVGFVRLWEFRKRNSGFEWCAWRRHECLFLNIERKNRVFAVNVINEKISILRRAALFAEVPERIAYVFWRKQRKLHPSFDTAAVVIKPVIATIYVKLIDIYLAIG